MITTMRNKLSLSLLVTFLFFTTQASAHSYHYEIQVSNILEINEENALKALNISFLYDSEVSSVLLQDQKDLSKLGKTLIKDLGSLGYFTQLKLNGKVLSASKATDIKLEKINMKNEGGSYDALQLNFTLPLSKPAVLTKNSEIALVHEDPSEAAILYYENEKHITVQGALKDSCKPSVKEKGKFAEGEFPQIITVNCSS